MNIIALTGNATKDVELQYTQTGTAIGKGTIAVRRDFKNKQTGQYETDFINFTVFGKAAEVMAKYIRKGDKFGINGRLQIDVYDDQNGQRKYFTNVIVNGFDFPDKKKDEQPMQQNQQQAPQQQYQQQAPQQNQQQAPQYQQGGFAPEQLTSQPQDNPFANTGGPLEVNDDDLPF